MRTIILDLSDELHKRLQELAKENNISIDSIVAAALGDEVSLLLAAEHLAEQSQKKHASQI
jgi:predicted transcriptional regulator